MLLFGSVTPPETSANALGIQVTGVELTPMSASSLQPAAMTITIAILVVFISRLLVTFARESPRRGQTFKVYFGGAQRSSPRSIFMASTALVFVSRARV